MASIEISIGNHVYELKGEDSEEHLSEVAELVKRRVEAVRKQNPLLTLQKATMLAAFDFASDAIKGRQKAVDYRTVVLSRATALLDRIEDELSSET